MHTPFFNSQFFSMSLFFFGCCCFVFFSGESLAHGQQVGLPFVTHRADRSISCPENDVDLVIGGNCKPHKNKAATHQWTVNMGIQATCTQAPGPLAWSWDWPGLEARSYSQSCLHIDLPLHKLLGLGMGSELNIHVGSVLRAKWRWVKTAEKDWGLSLMQLLGCCTYQCWTVCSIFSFSHIYA